MRIYVSQFIQTLLVRINIFLLFIDDFSRKTWMHFLKEKFEIFSTSKKLKVLIEKERGNNVKLLRSDRGGEFTTKEINEYCEIHVIYLPSTV